jgi:hypothetical protein
LAHDHVIEARDKFFAHRDLDAPIADWGFTNQLRLIVDSNGYFVITISPNIENSLAQSLLELVRILIPKMENYTRPFLETYIQQLPAPGHYAVNVHDENPTPWLELAKD